jgi:hypothetical protein
MRMEFKHFTTVKVKTKEGSNKKIRAKGMETAKMPHH